VAAHNLFDLTGRAAIVTGAASGLGREIALGLASAGADIALADLSIDVLVRLGYSERSILEVAAAPCAACCCLLGTVLQSEAARLAAALGGAQPTVISSAVH
jgi:NAD(P)-dependent dehydrogenase (short-subunit alcohol dehydrogenase family)